MSDGAGTARVRNANPRQLRRERRKAGAAAKRQRSYMDYGILFIVIFLSCFGLIMIYSITQYSLSMSGLNPRQYLNNQLRSMIFGLFLMLFIGFVMDYRLIQKISTPIFIAALCMIPLVLSPLGRGQVNGASRWLYIFGMSVQPSEIVKGSVIIFTAAMINKRRYLLQSFVGVLTVLATVAGIPAAMLFLITDNMSSAIIVCGIVFFMLFVASKKYWHYVLLGGGAVGAVGLLVYLVRSNVIDAASDFRFARITAWLDPYADSSGVGYQILQSLYSIGSGGIFGKGLGHSIQKMGYIPEAQNDMIFSIICEELGVFTGIAIIFMFMILIWRMMIVASNAVDLYGSMLVVGVMSHLGLQVVINVAVVTNVIPNTGIPLPFISYGGTAMFMFLAEIGIVISVARRIPVEERE